MERVLLETITNQMKQVIGKRQHHSPKTNHVSLSWPPPTTNNSYLNTGTATGTLYQDVSRAFDAVSHSLVLDNQQGTDWTRWVGNWLTVWQSTVFTQARTCHEWSPPGISILQHLHKHHLTKFADDTKLAAEVDTSEGKAISQTDSTGWMGG